MAETKLKRSGTGNGRVYHVSFRAGDGHGNTCQGEVRVAVPHSANGIAVDDGPRVDSTKR